MKIDERKHYVMPLLMGPIFDREHPPKYVYSPTEVIVIQYMTDPSALEALLPKWYRPGKEPLVTIFFGLNKGASFMAGGEFRTAAFLAEARFDGEKDHVIGDYILAMFENHTWPIIGGREDTGIPKLYADISDIKVMPNGHLRCEASYWGHLLFGLDVPPLRRQIGVLRVVASRQVNARPFLAHKYIPSLDGPPDADYPTLVKVDASVKTLWLGKKAALRFGTARYEDIGQVKTLMDALATLTIVRLVQVAHFFGSSVDRYDLNRRLR